MLRSIALVSAFIVALIASGDARADEKATCASTSEEAQVLKSGGKLVRARARLLECTRDTCPTIVRQDCVRWLAEIDSAIPTIVIRVREARGRDVFGVRVRVDGVTALDRLTGTALPFDPGPHHFVFVAASGDSVEQDVLIAEGERGRMLTATIPAELRADGTREAADARDAQAAPGAPAAPPASERAPIPTVTLVAGGLSLVALGAFGYFQLTALSDYRSLRDTCGATRSCSDQSVDSVRHGLIAADVSLGVGIAAAGVAAWAWLSAQRQPSSAPSRGGPIVEPRVVPGGSVVVVAGGF